MKAFTLTVAVALSALAGTALFSGVNAADAKKTPAAKAEAAHTGWLTDYPKALAEAKANKKFVLLDFTGSDYCIGCQALKKNVWDNPQFQKLAKEKLVLVEVDFPLEKPQPEALQKANDALLQQFKVTGYPTVIIVNGEGKEVFRDEGYDESPASAYVPKLEKSLK